MPYKIVRFYQNAPDLNGSIVTTGLTLDQAQAHCQDPESSSSTATSAEAVDRTAAHGAWFDGYTDEDR